MSVGARVVTFAQSVACAAPEELAAAHEAGATAVLCPPGLVAAALELGMVPLVEVALDRALAAYGIPVGDELVPSVAVVSAGGAAPPDYPLVTVVGDGAPAAIGRLRALLPASTRI